MKNKQYTIISECIERNYIVKESVLDKIFSVIDFNISLILQLVIYSVTFIYSQVYLKKSKINKKLTQKISKIVGEPWVVNILQDKDFVNAFCILDNGLIFISQGMIDKLKLTEDEQIAILLHEIGHGKENLTLLIRGLPEWVSRYALIKLIIIRLTRRYEGMLAILLLYFISHHLGVLPVSRMYEYKQDKFATDHGYGKHLISAFRKFIVYMNKELKKINMLPEKDPKKVKNPIIKLLLYFEILISTHPNTYDRIKKIQENIKISKTDNITSLSKKMLKSSNIPKEKYNKLPKIINSIKSLFN